MAGFTFTQHFIDEVVHFTSTLVTDFTASTGLDRLMRMVPEELGVNGAGVMLADDDDRLRFVSASDDTVRLIENLQIETGDGPCVRAAQTGEMVFADDLATDDRFGEFASRAVQVGMAAVHSFPMIVEGTSIGAMNLYVDRPGPLSDRAVHAGRVIADMCAAYLISARRADHASRMLERTRQAMDRNAPIDQAKGWVAHALSISPADAYELIRSHARNNQRRSLDVANAILDGALGVEELRRT